MQKPKLPIVRMVLWFPFALVLTAIGLFALIPPFTPLAFVFFAIAGVPYARWMSKKIHDDMAYADRDHSLNEGEPKPWEEDVIDAVDEALINIIINGSGRGSRD